VIALYLLGLVLFHEPSCGPWQWDRESTVGGVEVDAQTLATATFTHGHALYQDEIRERLDAVPGGGRCYLGRKAEDLSDAPMPVSWRMTEACGLECPAVPFEVPLLPNVDASVLRFGSYTANPIEHPGWLGYPRFGCVAIPVEKLESGRWRIAQTRADRAAPSRPRATTAQSAARRFWQRHECPYEHLIGLGDREMADVPSEANTLARAEAELDEARRAWKVGLKTSASCLAKRFTLFSDGDVDGKDVAWVGQESNRQIIDVTLALEAADALAKLRPLEPHERMRLPELWARLPLGIRAEEMCAALRSRDRLNLWSTTLAIAVLIHCPDALRDPDGRLPKVTLPASPIDDTPDGTQSLRDLLTPMCWARLASLRL